MLTLPPCGRRPRS